MRVFQLRDGDVRACVIPADLAVNLDMRADMSEPDIIIVKEWKICRMGMRLDRDKTPNFMKAQNDERSA